MDPNEALSRLRKAIVRAVEHQATGTGHPMHCEVPNGTIADVVESFNALDGWLESGGFLPADWQRG